MVKVSRLLKDYADSGALWIGQDGPLTNGLRVQGSDPHLHHAQSRTRWQGGRDDAHHVHASTVTTGAAEPGRPLMPAQARPAAVKWFLVYCGVLSAMYLGLLACGIVVLVLGPAQLDMTPSAAALTGGILTGVGAAFLAVSAAPFLLPPRPWVWIYDLVVICVGMTSACFLAASIPLLIFWIKPDVKAYFGRSP